VSGEGAGVSCAAVNRVPSDAYGAAVQAAQLLLPAHRHVGLLPDQIACGDDDLFRSHHPQVEPGRVTASELGERHIPLLAQTVDEA
jgi:hypothetical protein